MLVQLHHTFKAIICFTLILSFFTACKKNDTTVTPEPETPELPDLSTQIRSSASGFVTDENSNPVENAAVRLGTSQVVMTDADGYFSITDVDVVKNAAVISVEKDGYFKGIKTYIAKQDKAGFFRIRLIPKTISGSVSGNSGGDVTLTNGLKVSLPANAVVNAGSGAAYTGVVYVASYWINPTSATLADEMPGDLRGLATNGAMQVLTTYGMAAVELTGAAGELLQVASGKKATLTMPVPTAVNGIAPATLPLWSFDETKGLWKQEGTATKSGSTYVGEVSHFSFWNCDVPANYVQFECTIVEASGAPVPFAAVKISWAGNPNSAAWGYTDVTGYVGGAIPSNASLVLEVFNGYNCGNAVYSQNFSSGTTNVSLGNITATTTSIVANVSGTVTNCAGLAVTNGHIRMNQDGQLFRYQLDNTGAFNFNVLLCSGTSNVVFTAENLDQMEQGTALPYTLNAGANVVGNLTACGISTNEFLTYYIDGVLAGSYTVPTDSIGQSGQGNGNWYIQAQNNSGPATYFIFNAAGAALGTSHELLNFFSPALQQGTVSTPNTAVLITEFGSVGEYVAGTFSATFNSPNPPATSTVSGSFRVRRNF